MRRTHNKLLTVYSQVARSFSVGAVPWRFILAPRILGLTAVIALAAISLGIEAGRAHRQAAAVQALRAMGYNILYNDQTIDGVHFAQNSKESRWSAWLRQILGEHWFRRVTYVGRTTIHLRSPQAKVPTGICYITKLDDLQGVFDTAGCWTDSDLAKVGRCRKLKTLGVPLSRNVTDAGLHYLSTLEHLEFLNIDSTSITAVGIETLSNLRSLTTIEALDTAVSEKDVEEMLVSGRTHANIYVSPQDAQPQQDGFR